VIEAPLAHAPVVASIRGVVVVVCRASGAGLYSGESNAKVGGCGLSRLAAQMVPMLELLRRRMQTFRKTQRGGTFLGRIGSGRRAIGRFREESRDAGTGQKLLVHISGNNGGYGFRSGSRSELAGATEAFYELPHPLFLIRGVEMDGYHRNRIHGHRCRRRPLLETDSDARGAIRVFIN